MRGSPSAAGNGCCRARGARSRFARAAVRDGALKPLARRLAASPAPGHRALAAMRASAVEAGDYAAALALVSTAGRRADLRAEKILPRRYGFLWICNPKVASRSIIAALRAAGPGAVPIRGQTLEQVLARYPEAGNFYRFAFARHPCHRTFSFWVDKHRLARRDRSAYRWFIEPCHGVSLGMSFGEFCRWLATPCGSDAFADRHWLSRSRQIAGADGRLPDFLGRYETLEAHWHAVTGRPGMPFTELPRRNARRGCGVPVAGFDDDAAALLRRRYACDFRLGGYADAPAPCR